MTMCFVHRRWTTAKKLGYDLLECDKVIIPVHQGIHWVLAVIDFKATCVRFYDSLLGNDKGWLRICSGG